MYNMRPHISRITRPSAGLLFLVAALRVSPSVPAPTDAPTYNPTYAPTASPNEPNEFGNANEEVGPWPECVGWQGDDCADYIQDRTPDDAQIFVQPRNPRDIHRVYVRVDENNVVINIPRRG